MMRVLLAVLSVVDITTTRGGMRTMKHAWFVLVGMFLLIAAPSFAQTSVSGDWEVTILSPQGPSTATATLKQDGDKVSGVLKGPQGQLPFEGGTLTGDELKFQFSINFQGTPLAITLTGKVKDTTIEGKADFGGMAEGEWTAKRVEATAANGATAATPASPAAPAAASASTTPGSISGKWDVTFKTPQGDFPATATLTYEGGKLSGTFGSQMGEVPVSGSLEGNAVKLTLVAQTPNGEMNVSMTGNIEGDAIVNGTADVSGMGQMEWSAKRSKQ
jgi:hypothetical protein